MLCSHKPFAVSYASFYRDAKMGKDSGLEVDKNVRETSAPSLPLVSAALPGCLCFAT